MTFCKPLTPGLSDALLPSEPNERIAEQLTLLLTNISRFDFPGKSPDLLSRLLAASAAPDLQLTARLRWERACEVLFGDKWGEVGEERWTAGCVYSARPSAHSAAQVGKGLWGSV